ncbi:Cationic peroxidase 1 [Glycine soja]|uniref:peroxidase n=1 Tax=Glycine soja TaxID=3848 RepID=A0A0B2RN26_GLYSO|nr:Cationic peroxidase 1 [Glycine soja]
MSATFPEFKLRICLLLCIIGTGFADSANDLRPDFYKSQCPQALEAIKAEITSAGCDASNLLKDTANFTGEQSAIPSLDSRNGTDIIEKIKARVEKLCPGVVSCADIVAFAARDSVVATVVLLIALFEPLFIPLKGHKNM